MPRENEKIKLLSITVTENVLISIILLLVNCCKYNILNFGKMK